MITSDKGLIDWMVKHGVEYQHTLSHKPHLRVFRHHTLADPVQPAIMEYLLTKCLNKYRPHTDYVIICIHPYGLGFASYVPSNAVFH